MAATINSRLELYVRPAFSEAHLLRVLHGNDEFSVSEALSKLKESAGPADVRGPNTSVFEGTGFSPGEMIGAACAIPFLAERRLVIVHGLLSRIDEGQKGLGKNWDDMPGMLMGVPASTELIFVERQALKRNGKGLAAAGPSADVQEYRAPTGQALDMWVRGRFEHHGASVDRDVCARLAFLVGANLRQIDSEIQKLILYAGDRPVSREDVDTMVPDAREANIFTAVDAILERRPGVAMRLLYNLLDGGETVSGLLNMLARQVRLSLLACELSGRRVPQDEIGKRIQLTNRYALEKTIRQASRFSVAYLANVHRKLLEADVSIKTGNLEERLALEILVARVSAA